jgi:hypothetical protein
MAAAALTTRNIRELKAAKGNAGARPARAASAGIIALP